ncbi:MAG: methyltransferase domain-containing protein [Candidatus Vogelbacteria bacterium]|nr:methyltransferase domain-containing protein [Candidatus Vogelbacteria bacterium]
MSFLNSKKKYISPRNGELEYSKSFTGAWRVKIPGGEFYGGDYVDSLWREFIYKYKRYVRPQRVLILGVGAGRVIDVVAKLWPEATIDALDYDPVMIEIGRERHSCCKHKVNYIIGDAKVYLESCKSHYDLILIDLFSGNQPAPILKNQSFLSHLRTVASRGALILANIATVLSKPSQDIFDAWYKAFPEAVPDKYSGNKLSVALINRIPDHYYNIFQSEPYAKSLEKSGLKIVGKPGEYFFIQSLFAGFGVITAMHTDMMPTPEQIRKDSGITHGIIFWSPWRRVFAPKPWHKNFLPPLHQRGNGVSIVKQNYKDSWSQTSRRDLKKFLSSDIEIKRVTKEKFVAGLGQSLLSNSLKKVFASMLERLSAAKIEYWVTEKDGEVLGGLAVMDYGNTSAHLVAYMTKRGQEYQAGTGLIDYWNQYALKSGIKYLNFGNIRESGEPRAWQGYSDFKRKFMDREIVIENEYFRFF